MITEKELNNIKAKFKDKFDIDDATGNMHLKNTFNIPPIDLIYVKGGEFVMGDGSDDDNPKHKVKVSSFFMSKYQVTQDLYKKIIDKSPSSFDGDSHPVENVNWHDSMAFCKTLNDEIKLSNPISGRKDNPILNSEISGFRLPTEAEWEYAAGGGQDKQNINEKNMYAGSNKLDLVGWYNGNSNYEIKPVGLKIPNSLGLYDMSGNVWEWCLDLYDKEFYKTSERDNPVNLKKGSYRVLRGGSWDSFAEYCRVSIRINNVPLNGWLLNGFRLLLAF